MRESLFGALESTGLLDGTVVVDLYAGSGALGLEALSRGASHCDLVEKGQKAAQIVRRNAARVEKASGAVARTHQTSVQPFLRASQRTYDLAFVDPPYDLDGSVLADDLRALAPLLAPDAIVIVERATRSGEPDWQSAGLVALRAKGYGDTTLWWGEPPQDA